MSLLNKVFNINNSEWKPTAFSFLYFLFLMSSYFILRPVRDEMGIQAGIKNMQWLFTATFISMLLIVPVFGILSKRIARQQLIPSIYFFFTLNILVFYFLFDASSSTIIPALFFVWLSVFNLFAISIFWSFSSDIFTTEQAKRLYGPIAAGGSIGAIIGPILTTLLVNNIGIQNLLLISALLLSISALFATKLMKYGNQVEINSKKMNSDIWSGAKSLFQTHKLRQLSLFILLYTTISTFLYFQQAHIVSDQYASPEDRTMYFGIRDLLINSITLLFQFLISTRIIYSFGVTKSLVIVPLVASVGFLSLSLNQSIVVLLVFQILYKSLSRSIQRPAREVLFTSVGLEDKYRTKNIIDTTIYRGGDAMSGWLFTAISSAIASFQAIALVTLTFTLVWASTAIQTGKSFALKTIHHGNNEEDHLKKKSD